MLFPIDFERVVCHFELIGQKLIGFLDTGKVVMYQNSEKIRECRKTYGPEPSVFVDKDKLYFPTENLELLEWNLVSLEENLLMRIVKMMSAAPSEPDFLAVSGGNLLQTYQTKKELKVDFPQMGIFYWTAVLSLDGYVVVAGHSKSCLLSGSEFAKRHNYFLLVRLRSLEVLNKETPLNIECTSTV